MIKGYQKQKTFLDKATNQPSRFKTCWIMGHNNENMMGQNKWWLTWAPNNANKKVIIKNCSTLTDCISPINNTQTKDMDVKSNLWSNRIRW